MKIIFRLVVLSLLSFFVVSCGGGGSTDTGNVSGGLSIKIYDSNIEPLNNARVILHGADKKIIKEYIQTGSDGRANFGAIDSDKITLTASYGNALKTFVDVSPGDLELVMAIGADLNPSPNAQDCFRVEYSFLDGSSPISANYFVDSNRVSGGSLHSDGAHTQCYKQNDNTLSVLGFLNNPKSYGYVLDTQVTDPTIFNITIDKASTPFTWSANSVSNGRMSLTGHRKGINYWVAVPPLDTSQHMDFAEEFPVDFYQLSMIGDGFNQHRIGHYQILAQLPPHVDIPQISHQFFDIAYQESTKKLQWNFTGDPAPQYYSIYMMTNVGYTWEIYLSADATSVVVPDIPSDLLSLLGVSEIIPTYLSIYATSDTGMNNHEDELLKLNLRTDRSSLPRLMTSSSVSVLSPPPLTPIERYTGPQPFNADVQAYMNTVWNELIPAGQCNNCHDTATAANQSPYFLDSQNIDVAYSQALPFIDFNSPVDSRLATKVSSGHNCGADCADIASLIVDQITAWNNAR